MRRAGSSGTCSPIEVRQAVEHHYLAGLEDVGERAGLRDR